MSTLTSIFLFFSWIVNTILVAMIFYYYMAVKYKDKCQKKWADIFTTMRAPNKASDLPDGDYVIDCFLGNNSNGDYIYAVKEKNNQNYIIHVCPKGSIPRSSFVIKDGKITDWSGDIPL